MTKARPWGNEAKEDRDAAAERFQAILREGRRLQEIVRNGRFTRSELAYIAGAVIDHAQTGLRHLERQGAQTRPE